MSGFGRSPFGHNPFGRSDTGGDLIVNLFPEEYFDDSLVLQPGETIIDNDEDPLLKVLRTYANSIYQRRLDIDNLKTLVDPDLASLDIVRLYGDMLGLGIDKNDPDFLQRSFLKTASQWLQIKASTRGFEVRGLASGFNVRVDNFWRVDEIYRPLIPDFFQYELIPTEADPTAVVTLHTDQPPGTFAGTPTVEDNTYAKSSYIRVVFSVPIYQPGVNYNTLLDLIILKIRDVVGIHQELTAPRFEVIIPVQGPQLTFSVRIDENIEVFNFPESYYFDIIPADDAILDMSRPTVDILLTNDQTIPVDAIPSISMIIEEEDTLPIPITEAVTADSQSNEAILVLYVLPQQIFDALPADVQSLDQTITVTDTILAA